ncbi:hypothetical protein HYQ45_017897 [Verticillium longisporum]|nr:hypothetical protein HYQ45_017897 [Verticillium longisporum]
MTPNSRVYGMKHESSRRDVLSSSNVPGDSAAEAKANNERQTCKMEYDATCTEITTGIDSTTLHSTNTDATCTGAEQSQPSSLIRGTEEADTF